MSNAFTAKPDLSKFWKQVNKSQQVSVNGKQANAKPSQAQKAAFYNIIKPKERT